MPPYLAGREADIQAVEQMFEALSMNIPTQSVIFSGLRGVGKTVLINRLQRSAEERGIFCKHIEVEERKDFISQICCVMLAYASLSFGFVSSIRTARLTAFSN